MLTCWIIFAIFIYTIEPLTTTTGVLFLEASEDGAVGEMAGEWKEWGEEHRQAQASCWLLGRCFM